jgi:predicted enzyme related to lactoylglutathione lyase
VINIGAPLNKTPLNKTLRGNAIVPQLPAAAHREVTANHESEITDMHHSRLCAVLIDCRTSDVDGAARFWGEALGRPVDSNHPSSRGNYRMLETPPDEPIVEIQRVNHESRVHIDIETDDIAAEVKRLTELGAKVVDRLERWVVMEAPTGQRFCVVRVQRPGFPKNANRWD